MNPHRDTPKHLAAIEFIEAYRAGYLAALDAIEKAGRR